MSIDFTRLPPPERWERFLRLLNNHAPHMPNVGSTRREQDLSNANTTATMVSAAADGLGAEVPGPLGVATALATAGSVDDALDALIDTHAGMLAGEVLGGVAGPFVGGFIMIARGAHQSLDRGDQMVAYLLGMSGFTSTLARAVVIAMREATPNVRPPMPRIPPYIERMGDLYSATRRRWFEDGYDRVMRVLQQVDAGAPTSGDKPSKSCLIHIGMQTNQTAQFEENNWRLRQRVERIILTRLLRVDLNHQRHQLRRWANAA